MKEPIVITGALLAALAIFLFIKIYVLFRACRYKTLRRWLYFTQHEIIMAPTPQAAKLRKLQNRLSIFFVILFILAVVFLYLLR